MREPAGSRRRRVLHQGLRALSRLYRGLVGDDLGAAVLDSLTAKNIDLLLRSDKDLDLLRGVHGDDVTSRPRPRRPSDASTCDPDGERPW